jgi:PAS domain S-box-containing protein
MLGLFWAGVCEAFLRVAPDPQSASFWFSAARFGWLAGSALFLHFTYVLSNFKPRYFYLIYFPPVLMFILSVLLFSGKFAAGFAKEYFGYAYIPGSLEPFYILLYLSFVVAGLLLVYRLYKTGKVFYSRKRAESILWAALIPLLIGTITDEILPLFGVHPLPLAIQTIALMVGVAGYAVMRYSPVTQVSREIIAESVANAMYDGLFLVSLDGSINYTNPAGSRLSGYRPDELLGRKITSLFQNSDSKINQLIKKNGEKNDVEMSTFNISGNQGFIYLVRDLSRVVRSRKVTFEMNREEKMLIEREEEIMRQLARFSEIDNENDAKAWWQEVEKNGSQIASILKPVSKLGIQYLSALDEARKARDEVSKKVEEIDRLNQFMSGRDEVLKQLEEEYNNLIQK